jgi:hypothetical protein
MDAPDISKVSLRVKKLGDKTLEIHPPKSKAFNIETPDNLLKMHQLQCAVGKRGGGKTLATVTYLRALVKAKVLDRLFIITPSWGSNKDLFLDPNAPLPVDEEDVYDDPDDPSCIDDIIEKCKAEMRLYKEHKRRTEIYEQLKKALKNVDSDRELMDIDPELLIKAYNHDAFEEGPPAKYGGRKPVLALFVDDCQVCHGTRVSHGACER